MATTPIRPRQLLRHALDLAEHHVGAGRPIPTWLRRSTSASYYAVFHGLALAVMQQIAPQASEEDRLRLARSVGHQQANEVCRWVGGQGGGRQQSKEIVDVVRQSPDVVRFAATFVRLQEARHQADYDHLMSVSKASTLNDYRQAEVALDLLDRLTQTTEGQLFTSLIALNAQLR